MLLVMALGTWALTVIGTLFSALTVNLRLRELMLPHARLSDDDSGADRGHDRHHQCAGRKSVGFGMRLLVAFDIIFTLLAVVFVDTVLVG